MAEPIKIAKNGLRWVFFDLDDTLFDFRANSDSALLKLYKTDEYISCLYPDYQRYVDVYHTANSQLWEAYHHAEITADVLRRERFQEWRRTPTWQNHGTNVTSTSSLTSRDSCPTP